MKKEALSFGDVEQLLSELAQQDRQLAAREEAQTELMRHAARGEIRRVFFLRRCCRAACSMGMLALLGMGAAFLLPEYGVQAQMAASLPQATKRKAAFAPAPAESITEKQAECYSVTRREQGEDYELVIYSVPL